MRNGPAMILAGPGSGKTATMIRRVRMLIEEAGVPPDRILVVTFTRAAAAEMAARFGKLTSSRYPVSFGTFHSIFLQILRQSGAAAPVKAAPEKTRRLFLREALLRAGIRSEEGGEALERIAGEISAAKDSLAGPAAYAPRILPPETFRTVFSVYQSLLRAEGLIDFDDMVRGAYRLLSGDPSLLKRWQARFTHILVDEFQDINELQYETVRLLALPENNLYVVGDDDQSIYGFRGSRPELMGRYPKDYPGCRVLPLEANYRSAPEIVRAAGRLIACNRDRYDKRFRAARNGPGRLVFRRFPGREEETSYLLEELRRLLSAGFPAEEIAVLFRTRAPAAELAGLLEQEGIPCRNTARGNRRPSPLRGDLAAYAALAAGTGTRADLLRILNRPDRGIPRGLLSGEAGTAAEALRLLSYREDLRGPVRRLREDLSAIRRLPPSAGVSYLRHVTGYEACFIGRQRDPAAARRELDRLQAEAEGARDLREWAEILQKDPKEDAPAGERGVSVGTMHGAKGLEYRAVFLPDVCEGQIPYRSAAGPVLTEEERRLFYVAVTRAKDRLYVLAPAVLYGRERAVSRFAAELFGTLPE